MTISPILLTIAVIVLALIAFVVEWFPVDITAMMIAIVLILLGLVTPEEGISGFSNSATITVMAMFILSEGITRTGIVQVVRDWLVRWGGSTPTRQIFILGLIVGPITAFINNTAVVAIFLPIVEDWCKKQGISSSKMLIPLSYVTVLGGMITVIGTSTNVLASGLSKKLGYGEFNLFQFTTLGLITFIVGLVFVAFAAPRLLPDRKPAGSNLVTQNYSLRDYVTELIITPRSSLIGETLQNSQIQRKFDMDVLEIIRNETHFPQPLADKTLAAGDILLVRGTREDLLKIKEERGLDILPDVQFSQNSLGKPEVTLAEEGVAEVLILSNSNLVGSTLKELRFRQRYNGTVLAIRRGQDLIRERLGKIALRFGDVLLIQGPKQSFLGLQTNNDLLVIEQRDLENLRQDKAWIALVIIFSVIVVAAFNWMPILVSSLVGVMLMIITKCLKPGEIYEAVRWDVIFLLAGLIPLGIAMDKSGATEWLASTFLLLGNNLSGYWILTFFYIATSLITEILSNNAAVLLILPIAVEVAKSLNLNPYAFMFAVTFAASNSFMTPIGYQTNTMVYGPGGYKFIDFLKLGGLLNLLMMIIAPVLIVLIYGLNP